MAATCGHTVMVHMARQLDATHVQEVVHMAAYGGYAHIVRLCHNYDQVEIDEAMVWAADGGHEEVVRLCRELERPISTRLCYGQQVAVKKTSCDCVVIGVSSISINSWPGQQNVAMKI